MNIRKTLFSLAVMTVGVGMVWAQDAKSTAEMEAPPEMAEPEIKGSNDAMALLDQFLAEKGWNEGAVEIKGKNVIIQKELEL